MSLDTLRLTAKQANDLLTAGEVSSDEIFAAYRAAIDERDPELNCFLNVCDESPGNGIPIALKDVISTKGIPTTAGSGDHRICTANARVNVCAELTLTE